MDVSRRMLKTMCPEEECTYYLRVTDLAMMKTKTDKDYFAFTAHDQSGQMPMVLWDVSLLSAQNRRLISETGLALVQFRTNVYKDKVQGKVISIKGANLFDIPQEEIQCLVPLAPENDDFYLASLYTLVHQFEDEDLKGIIEQVLRDNSKYLRRKPAAKAMHDDCINGLLHHTTRMAETANLIRPVYPEVNWDLVIAGAIVHDIGKIQEFKLDALGLVSDYSKRGKMLGHQYIGIDILQQSVQNYILSEISSGGFPKNDKGEGEVPDKIWEFEMLLSHMIESHHGKPEYGSAIIPKFMEAKVLNYLDELDAKIVMFKKAESDLEPGSFSAKTVFGLETSVYRPSFK